MQHTQYLSIFQNLLVVLNILSCKDNN
uniref:Uncharacterized protein n=1 Tax=Anguilla anguilla TaxID=7936 RepID=A0A0E9TUI2_ANGAN